MLIERINCAESTDVSELSRALEPLGASVTVTSEPSSAVVVHLPDDEYREKRCRNIVDQWQCRRSGPVPGDHPTAER